MEEKIKAFLRKHWKITLAAVLLVTIMVAVVSMMTLPFKKTAEDLGFIEMHENVGYAIPRQSFASTVLPVTNQKRIDSMLNVLHEAEFQEILWTFRTSGYLCWTITFCTVEVGEEVYDDDVHTFVVMTDVFKRQVIAYTNGGRTRYFTCTKWQEFYQKVDDTLDMYTRH